MFGFVGCTTMRPMCWVFSRPIFFQVRPPSVLLKMPQPGSMVLREFCSPVPAQTCIVSDGAIASDPIATQRSRSNTGRNVVPLFVVFQMPPPAAATKNVFDGLGMPAMSAVRPSKFAGPTVRHRNDDSVSESSICECAGAAAATTIATPADRDRRLLRDIRLKGYEWVGARDEPAGDILTIALRPKRG